jgi:hypothetical protein
MEGLAGFIARSSYAVKKPTGKKGLVSDSSAGRRDNDASLNRIAKANLARTSPYGAPFPIWAANGLVTFAGAKVSTRRIADGCECR